MLHLRAEELHRVGQSRAAEEFFVQASEDILRRQVVGESLAEGAEEVRLLDVLLAIKDEGSSHVLSVTETRMARTERVFRLRGALRAGRELRLSRVRGFRRSRV